MATALIAGACSWATTNLAVNAAPSAPGSESLDRQLLEDFGSGLLDDLQVPTSPRKPAEVEPAAQDPSVRQQDTLRLPTDRDGPLFRKYSDQVGEDVGQPSAESPLVDIESSMRAAQELISELQDVERGTAVQQQVVADLDALIAQLVKQCAGGQSSSDAQCENPGSRRSEVPSAKPGSASAGRGTTAAQDSTSRLDSGAAAEVDMAEMQELMKDLWGHLPQRVREQLLQAPTDEFLPKYELEIEKYFRRLAEEGRQDDLQP